MRPPASSAVPARASAAPDEGPSRPPRETAADRAAAAARGELPPPPKPSSANLLAPLDALRLVLQRLAHNDNPEPNSGLATLYNFKFPSNYRKDDWPPNLEAYLADPTVEGADHSRLVNCSFTALDSEPEQRDPQSPWELVQRATLFDAAGEPFPVIFHLNGFWGRWCIQRIEFPEPEPDEPDDDDHDENEDGDDEPPTNPTPTNPKRQRGSANAEPAPEIEALTDPAPEPANGTTQSSVLSPQSSPPPSAQSPVPSASLSQSSVLSPQSSVPEFASAEVSAAPPQAASTYTPPAPESAPTPVPPEDSATTRDPIAGVPDSPVPSASPSQSSVLSPHPSPPPSAQSPVPSASPPKPRIEHSDRFFSIPRRNPRFPRWPRPP